MMAYASCDFTIPNPIELGYDFTIQMSLDEELLRWVREHGSINCTEMSELTGYTRQSVHRHLSALVERGALAVAGRARATRYYIPQFPPGILTLEFGQLAEDELWESASVHLLPSATSPAAAELTRRVLLEVIQNALTHSASASGYLRCFSEPEQIRFELKDNGIGLFARLKEQLGLSSPADALFKLSKAALVGRMEQREITGLFKVFRACNRVEIEANGLLWVHDAHTAEQTLCELTTEPGTKLRCQLALQTALDWSSLFSLAPALRRVGLGEVKLYERSAGFVSRAEAEQLLRDMESYDEICLNFQGVTGVGLKFAAYIFHEWAPAHPHIQIHVENANAIVARVLLEAGASPSSLKA